MSGTGLGRAAIHCYTALKVVIGCIPFSFKWEEIVVVGGTKTKVEFVKAVISVLVVHVFFQMCSLEMCQRDWYCVCWLGISGLCLSVISLSQRCLSDMRHGCRFICYTPTIELIPLIRANLLITGCR